MILFVPSTLYLLSGFSCAYLVAQCVLPAPGRPHIMIISHSSFLAGGLVPRTRSPSGTSLIKAKPSRSSKCGLSCNIWKRDDTRIHSFHFAFFLFGRGLGTANTFSLGYVVDKSEALAKLKVRLVLEYEATNETAIHMHAYRDYFKSWEWPLNRVPMCYILTQAYMPVIKIIAIDWDKGHLQNQPQGST